MVEGGGWVASQTPLLWFSKKQKNSKNQKNLKSLREVFWVFVVFWFETLPRENPLGSLGQWTVGRFFQFFRFFCFLGFFRRVGGEAGRLPKFACPCPGSEDGGPVFYVLLVLLFICVYLVLWFVWLVCVVPIPYPIPSMMGWPAMMHGWPAGYDGGMAHTLPGTQQNNPLSSVSLRSRFLC